MVQRYFYDWKVTSVVYVILCCTATLCLDTGIATPCHDVNDGCNV